MSQQSLYNYMCDVVTAKCPATCRDHAVTLQILQVSEVMEAAGKGAGNSSIAMQCFQQLHTILGEADSSDCDAVTEKEIPAMLTLSQAVTTASTLKGMSWHHQAIPAEKCTPPSCLWGAEGSQFDA